MYHHLNAQQTVLLADQILNDGDGESTFLDVVEIQCALTNQINCSSPNIPFEDVSGSTPSLCR